MSRAPVAAAFVIAATLVLVDTAAAGVEGKAPAPRALLASEVQPRLASLEVAAATAWCGSPADSDRVPNVVAGSPIHWIYLVPSDAADDFETVAARMQSDGEEIDAWWRGQDSSRTPRNDVASFPCGTQLDITVVRSSRSGAQLMSLGGRFSGIVDSLRQAGLTSQYDKYLVYYDGPIDDDNVCGQGGSDPSGFGVGVVFYRSCAGVSTAAVAAHEFLHTIGAVPTGAPHDCTGDASGHTCDDEADIMYPSIGGGPLSVKVLDSARDDYYGHAGDWLDTQDSAWLVRLDSQAQLALTISGQGAVAADVPGLQCTASCATTWNAGQTLTLSTTPAAGSRLLHWGGACSGAGTCSLTVTPGAAVSALFVPAAFRLTVAVSGRGTVRSSRAGITCRPRCSASVASYTPVRLVAAPAKGWKLRSWSGACRGVKKTCTVPMKAATKARATFVRGRAVPTR